MPLRPTTFIPPSSDISVQNKRYLTNIMEQIDKLQGNIANNASTLSASIDELTASDIVTDDRLSAIGGQLAEQAVTLQELENNILNLSKGVQTAISNAIEASNTADARLQNAISANASRVGSVENGLNSVRAGITDLKNSISSLSSRINNTANIAAEANKRSKRNHAYIIDLLNE